jgi:hypothetical protein
MLTATSDKGRTSLGVFLGRGINGAETQNTPTSVDREGQERGAESWPGQYHEFLWEEVKCRPNSSNNYVFTITLL